MLWHTFSSLHSLINFPLSLTVNSFNGFILRQQEKPRFCFHSIISSNNVSLRDLLLSRPCVNLLCVWSWTKPQLNPPGVWNEESSGSRSQNRDLSLTYNKLISRWITRGDSQWKRGLAKKIFNEHLHFASNVSCALVSRCVCKSRESPSV